MDLNKQQQRYGGPLVYDAMSQQQANRIPPNMQQQNMNRYIPYAGSANNSNAGLNNYGREGGMDNNSYAGNNMSDGGLQRAVSYGGRLPSSMEAPSNVSFDSSDFPALNRNVTAPENFPPMQNMTQRQHSDFTIQNEDFPALGGGPPSSGDSRRGNMNQGFYSQPQSQQQQQMNMIGNNQRMLQSMPQKPIGDSRPMHESPNVFNQSFGGVQQSPSGYDAGMMQGGKPPAQAPKRPDYPTDGMNQSMNAKSQVPIKKKTILPPDQQYGLLGLLPLIRMEDPDRCTLALGIDLTSLGLNLNSSEALHTTFVSPWVDRTSPSKEPQFQLPASYSMKGTKGGLKPTQFPRLVLETLFYIFYSMPRDTLQLLAAQELYNRDWRYHTEHKVWFYQEQTNSGTGQPVQYSFFDVQNWERRPFPNPTVANTLAAGFMQNNVLFSGAKSPQFGQ